MKSFKYYLTFTVFLTTLHLFVSAQNQEDRRLSPYVFPQFVYGSITKNGIKQQMKINYNIVTEEMICDNEGKYVAISPSNIDTAYLGNRVFVPVGKAFYEVGTQTNIALLIRYKGVVDMPGKYDQHTVSTLIPPTSDAPLTDKDVLYALKLPINFSLSTEKKYYLLKNGKYIEVNNVKQIQSVFSDNSDKIKAYAKLRHLNIDKTNDTKALVVYSNNLTN